MANEVPADLTDIVLSLTAIMEEETGRLLQPGRHADMVEMTAAKGQLVAALEARGAALARERSDWMEQLEPSERLRLAGLVRDLNQASILNARVLQRQIDLSSEMMAAVAAEAQRATGARNATYGQHGALSRTDQATPISLNARL